MKTTTKKKRKVNSSWNCYIEPKMTEGERLDKERGARIKSFMDKANKR